MVLLSVSAHFIEIGPLLWVVVCQAATSTSCQEIVKICGVHLMHPAVALLGPKHVPGY